MNQPAVEMIFDSDSLAKKEPEGGTDGIAIGAARLELDAMAALISAARATERDWANRDVIDAVVPDAQSRAVARGRSDFIDAYGELASRGYGKVVTARSEETGELATYRIAQANVTMVTGDGKTINVINRLAPVAHELVSARVGDGVMLPKIGFSEVIAVELLSGWTEAPSDIRALICDWIDHDDREHHRQIDHCQRSVESYRAGQSAEAMQEKLPRPVHDGRTHLGHEFYTQTSRAQEELIKRNGRGVVWVEGIAGSGKTSVGLGLLKALHDRRLFGEDDDEHDAFFSSQSNMLAVVLSAQLVGYLKETCRQLHLGDVPVQEYGEVRRSLMRRFSEPLGLNKPGGRRYRQDNSILSQPSMAQLEDISRELYKHWVRDIDARLTGLLKNGVSGFPTIMATVDGDRSRLDLNRLVHVTLSTWKAGFIQTLEELGSDNRRFPLERFSRLVAERRRSALAAFRAETDWYWHGDAWKPTRPPLRKGEDETIAVRMRPFARETYLNRTDFEALQKAREKLGEQLAEALRLTRDSMPSFVEWYESALKALAKNSDIYQRPLSRIQAGTLAGADIDVMIAMLMLVLYGDDETRGRTLFAMDRIQYSSIVFVDEVQDFSEVELFTLTMMADPKRSAVMVVGDRWQQLTKGATREIGGCFPRARDLEPILLDQNFRQTENLANFSLHIRKRIGGVVPRDINPWIATEGELELIEHNDEEQMLESLVTLISESRDSLSMAVIAPNPELAEVLHGRLAPELEEQFIDVNLAADGRDLTKINVVHFTSPKPAKGLEFDVVFVPYWNRFDLDKRLSGDGAYVAVTRPKTRLVLMSDSSVQTDSLWPDGQVIRRD